MEKKFDLEDRLVSFAASIVIFCKDLPNDWTGLYYGKQLLRSGGGVALNFGEYQGANIERDRINKLSISLKELKESIELAHTKKSEIRRGEASPTSSG